MSKWNVTLILNKEFQIVLCLQSQTLPDLHYPQWKLSWLSHWRFYCWNKRLYDANKMLSWKGNWTKQEFDIYCYYTHLPFVLSYSLSHIRLLQDDNCELAESLVNPLFEPEIEWSLPTLCDLCGLLLLLPIQCLSFNKCLFHFPGKQWCNKDGR